PPQYEPATEYPLITVAAAEVDRPVLHVRNFECRPRIAPRLELASGALGDPDSTALLARRLVADGGCIAVIANTVGSAQAIFQAIRHVSTGLDVVIDLFHARFTADRRQQIESRVHSRFGPKSDGRPRRAILVATQVVEQSLDLDFDAMIS